ncbi:MAG: glycosidase [Acidimicrobiaceae bacterium]|nr:glycosidase [Acidimicrobiaceae bacterium]
MKEFGIARRGEWRIRADHDRVITALFLPGQDLGEESETRASATSQRVLALSDDEVTEALEEIARHFGDRHRDLDEVFLRNSERVHNHVGMAMSLQRRQLLGAVFTHEFTLEGSGLCNPSLVAHPDQTGVLDGEQRVVMSYRALGEGHFSTIGFRTGVVNRAGTFTLDASSADPVAATIHRGVVSKRQVRALLFDERLDSETVAWVLQHLEEEFTERELNEAIVRIDHESDLRLNVISTAALLRTIASNFYLSTFPETVELNRRILMPTTPAECRGLEDARFVRIVDGERSRYQATCAAFDGKSVSQKLIETDDFTTFSMTPLAGRGARNKGLALFPRQIRGRYVALSRYDHVSNFITFSDDGRRWDEVFPIQRPGTIWSILQVGNCGSPIELEEGWLVMTHGIGPMRTYGIGAILLDLEDPTKVIADLPGPLLTPNLDEQNGYVPNVVYSCGSLLYADQLFIPYGIADQSISYATVSLDDVREHLRPVA